MALQVLDSHLRCPRDGKRLLMEIGQEDGAEDDMMRARHFCFHCDYYELDTAWSRPMRTDGLGVLEKRAERLAGREVPMAYDRTPVTVEEALGEH